MGNVNKAIWADYVYLNQVYPELMMCGLEVNPRLAHGTIILPEFRSEPREIRARVGFPITVKYKDDFPDEEIEVFDAGNRIDWNKVPREHQHTFGGSSLCTHHTDLLQLVRNKENTSILIVRSAILLYLAYLECLKTGKWPERLLDLPHDRRKLQKIIKADLRKVDSV